VALRGYLVNDLFWAWTAKKPSPAKPRLISKAKSGVLPLPESGEPVVVGGGVGAAVTGGSVTGGSVTGGSVTGGSVTGGFVTGGSVTGGSVTGGLVTGRVGVGVGTTQTGSVQ